jgi:hypothetical protein
MRKEVSVFPNPMSSKAVLTFQNEQHKPHSILIFDHLGNIVKKFERFTGDQVEFEKGKLGSGIYYFRLLDEQKYILSNGKIEVI